MASRVIRRGSTAAAGVWASALVGFLGTVVAARLLSVREFGLLAIVLGASGFVQLLLDLTVEEALVKYGFRYAATEQWGRLHRLFRVALRLKLLGAAVGAAVVVALAPLADWMFGERGLLAPMLVAALLPLVTTAEPVAAAALIVRERYDVRALFLMFSMAVRLAAIAIGASYGLVETVVALVVAQALSTVVLSVVAFRALRAFPAAPAERIGAEGNEIRTFVLRSSVGSALVSMRALLPPVLLGVVSPAAQVAFFRAAQAPQAGFANLSAPARLILLTEQTRDFERGRLDRMWSFLERYVAGTAVFVVVAIPLFWWLMPGLVRIVFGSDYEDAVDATRLILLAASIQLVWGWTKSLPVTIGRPGLKILTHAIELVVLVPLVLAFGAAWGATGAAGAVALSTGVFALAWAVVLARLRRDPPRAVTPATPPEAVAP